MIQPSMIPGMMILKLQTLFLIAQYPVTASELSSARTNPAIKLLVYPDQDPPHLYTNPLPNTHSQRYQANRQTNRQAHRQTHRQAHRQAHRQTNRPAKHNCSLLEEILTTILNEKKKKLRRLLGKTNGVKNRPNRYNLPQSTYKNNVPTYIKSSPTNTNLGPTYSPIPSLPTPQPTTATVLDYTIKHSYTSPENPIQVIPGITPYNPPRPWYSSRPLPNTLPQTGYRNNNLNPSRQPPRSMNQIFRDVLNAKRNILNKLVNKNTRRPASYPSHPTQHIVPYPVSFQPPPFNYNRIPAMHDSSYTFGKYCIF